MTQIHLFLCELVYKSGASEHPKRISEKLREAICIRLGNHHNTHIIFNVISAITCLFRNSTNLSIFRVLGHASRVLEHTKVFFEKTS